MKTYYFTGTGNSLQVARAVGAGGELISIPLFLREHSDQTNRPVIADDAIGIVFPTYWLALPPIICEFLEMTRFETDYLFAITTRGHLSLTLKSHLLQKARQNGHRFSYFNKLSMPDNWLPSFDMKKEKQRFTEEALNHSIDSLVKDIRARKRNLSGHAGTSFLRPFLLGNAEKQMSGFSRRFSVDDSCNNCGTCAQVCSAQCITYTDGLPVHGKLCNGCLACVQTCLSGAIHMHSEKSTERYLNPTVRVADIIAAHSGGQ